MYIYIYIYIISRAPSPRGRLRRAAEARARGVVGYFWVNYGNLGQGGNLRSPAIKL